MRGMAPHYVIVHKFWELVFITKSRMARFIRPPCIKSKVPFLMHYEMETLMRSFDISLYVNLCNNWTNKMHVNKYVLAVIWRLFNTSYIPVVDKAKTDHSINLVDILTCESHRWHTLPVYVWYSKPTYSIPSTVFLHVFRSVKKKKRWFGRHEI